MIRILHVLNNLGSGGAESFVMNIYRNIDRSAVQFDFLIRSTENGPMVDEIKSMGGHIYILPSFPKHILSNYRALDYFLKKHHGRYKAIHVHANALIYVKPLELAKKYGIPVRIIHSHNTGSRLAAVHKLNINRIEKWITDRFACSDLAGEWMFPGKEYRFIPNGIDLEKFSFNASDREDIRNRYNIGDKKVIGNVGRFMPQKNHPFLIDVFDKYHKKNPDSVLMLVGSGVDREKIEKLVCERGLQESVIFTGAVVDVWKYLSAMDVFLFPSLWEGLGIALIEAQTNGLPVVCSDVIPSVARINSAFTELSLKADISDWSEKIDSYSRGFLPNFGALRQFDIKIVAKELEKFYLG